MGIEGDYSIPPKKGDYFVPPEDELIPVFWGKGIDSSHQRRGTIP
jgi:hypothetical protein